MRVSRCLEESGRSFCEITGLAFSIYMVILSNQSAKGGEAGEINPVEEDFVRIRPESLPVPAWGRL